MPLRKSLPVVVLLLLGAAFAVGNLWFSAVRSTIPLHLDGHVTHKDRLFEKTLGVDDVYVVTIGDDTPIQVDRSVYEAIDLNCLVHKDAWSRKLEIDDRTIELEYSSDFKGMTLAMPSFMLVIVIFGIAGHLWK